MRGADQITELTKLTEFWRVWEAEQRSCADNCVPKYNLGTRGRNEEGI